MRYTRYSVLQKGQALLVVILVMVVALTVGLSVATRSLTNTKLSTEEENSKRAFSAAEAGVQEALKSNVSPGTKLPSQSLGNNSQYRNVTVDAVKSKSFFLNNGSLVTQDDGADIWFVPHDPDGKPSLAAPLASAQEWIYFSNTGSTSCSDPAKVPALEVVLISGPSISQAVSKHFVYDPCSSRSSANNMTVGSQTDMSIRPGPWSFPDPSSGVATNFDYAMVINVTNGYFMRVIPLYANSIIFVDSTIALPPQGTSISSTGISGNTQRKLTVFRSFAKLPAELFPYIIFSSK